MLPKLNNGSDVGGKLPDLEEGAGHETGTKSESPDDCPSSISVVPYTEKENASVSDFGIDISCVTGRVCS